MSRETASSDLPRKAETFLEGKLQRFYILQKEANERTKQMESALIQFDLNAAGVDAVDQPWFFECAAGGKGQGN